MRGQQMKPTNQPKQNIAHVLKKKKKKIKGHSACVLQRTKGIPYN